MVDKSREISIKNWHYRRLFWSIIVLFVFVSFIQIEFGGVITSTLLTVTILIMVRAMTIPRAWKFGLRGLVAIALFCDVLTLFVASPLISHQLFTLADIVYAVFLGTAIITLSQQLNRTNKVDQDVLLGAISVYLLIGIFWFLLYRISFALNSNNFSQLSVNNGEDFVLLYFSFTTLTTLGYGDITPTDSIAMGLSNMEAIIGQMYPAIFVARLVSLYTAELSKPESKDTVD